MRAAALAAGLLVLAACKDRPPEPAPPSAAASAPVVTKPGEPVAFGRQPLAAGTRFEMSLGLTMSVTLTFEPPDAPPTKSDVTATSTSTTAVEIVAAQNGVPTKMKVTFTSSDRRAKEGNEERPVPSRVAGKTYVATASDGGVDIRDDRGKLVAADEIAEATPLLPPLGKPDPLGSALPTEPLRPGDAVPPVERALATYMERGADGMKVSDVHVTLLRKDGDDGVFGVTVRLGKDDARTSLRADLTGEMRVSTITGVTTRVEVGGPVTVAPKPDGQVKVSGSGAMKMRSAMTVL